MVTGIWKTLRSLNSAFWARYRACLVHYHRGNIINPPIQEMRFRPNRHRDRISISDVVAIVYCERQAVLDRQLGRRRTAAAERMAIEGQQRHKSFEGKGRQQQDRRCFVATAIYGADAPETQALRAWRDQRLMPSAAGRTLVEIYYRLSPLALALIAPLPGARTLIRRLLDSFCRRVVAPITVARRVQ